MPTYSLAELATLADVTPRTVRFYISQGLLPAPAAQGPNTRYTDEHLSRLRVIKKLQAAHLPLAEIRQHLRAVAPDELDRFAEADAPSTTPAIDYIRDLLHGDFEGAGTFARRVAESGPAPPPRRLMIQPAAAPPAPAAAPALQAYTPSEPARSQWERISLDPDIELHIRRPLTRQQNKRVERLTAIARELFEEE